MYIRTGDLQTNQVSDRWREDRVRAFQGVGDGSRSSSVSRRTGQGRRLWSRPKGSETVIHAAVWGGAFEVGADGAAPPGVRGDGLGGFSRGRRKLIYSHPHPAQGKRHRHLLRKEIEAQGASVTCP